MKVRLFSIPGSPPAASIEAMLRHKGIAYKRVDFVPLLAKPLLRLFGFPKYTVPAMKIDGRKIQGSREIAHELDRLQPEPALLPADPERRIVVEEAERFGDEELQHPVRQIVLWSIKESKSSQRSYLKGTRLGMPVGLAAAVAPPIMTVYARFHRATEANVRADLERLGGMLDRIDGWIAEGVLDGEQLNTADFQIAGSLRLALTLRDLRPLIDGRPAGRLARRALPDFPGDCMPALPAAWLEPLREATVA